MFEKEAKERAEEIEAKQTLGVYDNDEDFARDEGWNDGYVSGYEEGFQNGAEYGYNKAKEEDKTLIEKMKCCGNCKYYQFQNDTGYYTCIKDGKRNGKNYRSCEFNLEKWEICK